MASQQKVHDPGWNDPPTFSYDKAAAIQASAGKSRLSLNKRVPFPMSGDSSKPNSAGIDPTIPPAPINIEKIGAPPVGTPPAPALLPTSVSNESSSSAGDHLEEVLSNLGAVHNLDGGDDISKRVKIMEDLWKDGKFDSRVQLRLLELSEALQKGDVAAADHVQKSLMVDYVSICSPFMGGIRQLINLRRADSL